MESFLNRYRNITVLLVVIFGQLLLLAVQVKNDQDVRMLRVWAVTAVTPVARVVEGVRGGGLGFIRSYLTLYDTNAENRRLREELGRIKLENIFLKNELNTADRAKALQVFQTHTPSKTQAATVVGVGAGSSSKVLYVDAGTPQGIQRGMAVVTPDGIVGKVIAAYPTASEVLLVTDPDFAAGVISQTTGVRGTLKGLGTPMVKVDYIPSEEKVQVGEWFYTSGDDRIFPRGFPVGVVKVVRDAQPFKEILLEPSGLQRGVQDVLIITQGVHQDIPTKPPVNQPVYIAPPPPADAKVSADAPTTSPSEPGAPAPSGTEADKLRNLYKTTGEAEGHVFGSATSPKPPDFTRLGAPAPKPATPNPAAPTGTATPPAPSTTTAPPATVPPAPAGTAPGATPPAAARPAPKKTESTRLSNQSAGAQPEGKQH
jgi:rod shape-determining protein MreC